jgi:ubiquinone/menaquinone biosynthesis C-methylase UbiE
MCEYDQTIACYYDMDSLGMDGDVDFYVEEARESGSPLLELGCGTGRITIRAAESGIEVVGLDISEPMLEIARSKADEASPATRSRITLLEGDMRAFDFDRKFNMVAIPYRAFMHMLTPKDQLGTLRCAYRHLNPGGKLALNFFDPKLHPDASEFCPFEETDFTHPNTGRRVISTVTGVYNKRRQIIACDFTYKEIDKDGRVISENHSPITLRWVYRHEMEHLLELCGFEIEALYGDFRRGPFKYGGEQIWVCRRPK